MAMSGSYSNDVTIRLKKGDRLKRLFNFVYLEFVIEETWKKLAWKFQMQLKIIVKYFC